MKTIEFNTIFDKVVMPKLIKMAIEGTLPMDMSQLDSSAFENEVREYLRLEQNPKAYERAKAILSLDNMSAEVAVELIANPKISRDELLDYAHDDIHVVEIYEYLFTIQEFLDEIGYII